MRLINVSTLKLHNFFDEANIPEYAILSHTWGASEVTFKELRKWDKFTEKERADIKEKEGYHKIMRCCAQAKMDGLEWCWVDTCCIDKKSSAELSEAINSMFKWYRNAAVCYAYLDDIEISETMKSERVEFVEDEARMAWTVGLALVGTEELAKARWFTRGWTLQELIAPENVVFYAKEWTFVGNKKGLKDGISQITGVDEATLLGGSLEASCVAVRMNWAGDRVTTRVEDMAYCLLGIFDVNMPLLYGEGEKAFVRLQEEIMKNSEDQSLLAWNPVDVLTINNTRDIPPMSPGEGRSVFATHPREFLQCSNLYTSIFLHRPYTLSNKGVRLKTFVLPLKSELCLVVISCYDSQSHSLLAIPAQRLETAGMDLYVRHDKVGTFSVEEAMVAKVKEEKIYLCKKVPDSYLKVKGKDSEGIENPAGIGVNQSPNEHSSESLAMNAQAPNLQLQNPHLTNSQPSSPRSPKPRVGGMVAALYHKMKN